MLTKFELRLQLDSASIAAINLAISQSMQQVAAAIQHTCSKMRHSMHDLAFFQREALEKSGQLHTLLVRKYMDEVDRASRHATPVQPVQPSHPPPAALLKQSALTVPKGSKRPGSSPPAAARAVAPRTHIPKTHLTPHLPRPKAMPKGSPQSPAKTEDFHLHHFLVVIKQSCSLH